MTIAESSDNETISIDFSCVNCDKIFPVSKRVRLYCSIRCRDDAHLIRDYRAYKKDGRINDPKFQKAIIVRLKFAHSKKGYYDQNARKLPTELRSKIIDRDKGLCCKCGKSGNEIHHINGNSQDLENLQLLCHDCHMEKSLSGLKKLDSSDERYAEAKERADGMWLRIDAILPKRACDDSENWNVLRKQMESERRQSLKQIKEDSQGTAKKGDTFEAKLIIQEIDDLAELELQLEVLELQKQAQIDQILTSEIKSKIEAIKLDFANSVQDVRENIENSRKRIKEDVLRYGSTVEGKALQARWNKGQPSLNWKSLREYAESHPEILDFWKEGTPFVSFYKVSRDKKQKS